jgi:signal transduction histidine kinase
MQSSSSDTRTHEPPASPVAAPTTRSACGGLCARVLAAGRRHTHRVVYGFSLVVVAIAWGVLAGFIAQQRADILHEIGTSVADSQRVLGAHLDGNFESATTLMKIADQWLMAQSSSPERPALEALGTYVGRLTSLDEHAIRLVSVDDLGHETLLTRHGASAETGPVVAVNLPPRLELSDRMPVKVGVERFDALAGSQVLPMTMQASRNAYGVVFIRALLPLRADTGPFAALLANLPGRIGAIRKDGQIVFMWPQADAKLGQYAPAITALARTGAGANNGTESAAADRAEPLDFARIEGVPEMGEAFVSYAPIDDTEIGVFAAVNTKIVDRRLMHAIALPAVITVLFSVLVLAGGHVTARLIRHNLAEAAVTRRALQAAEAANEAKRQFLANMSHELRTPLNAIIGFAEIMHNQLFGPLGKPQYVTYIGDVLDSGRHLLGLIQTMLDMARFEDGRVKLGEDPVLLRDMLRDATRILQDRLAAGQIDLHIEVDAGLEIRMDPLHLRQILINVIGNAIKFSHPRGVIAVTGRAAPDGGYGVEIADNGIGIPAEAIGKLFQPFSQVDSAYSRKQGGVGLGLAICRSIMEAYGGGIGLRSELGRGTTVLIRFPAARVTQNPAAAPVTSTGILPRPEAAE